MALKKFVFTASITASILLVGMTSVTAYKLSVTHPNTRTLYWGHHETAPSSIKAVQTTGWTATDGFQAYYNNATYSEDADPYDSVNSVGDLLPSGTVVGGSSNWVAATYKPASTYSTFDIVLHAKFTFGSGSGSSGSYLDSKGVLAHEFGHVFGLADLYPGSTEIAGKSKYTVPTMYGNASFFQYVNGVLVDSTRNVFYYLRSPESDDVNGKRSISASIG